MLALQIILIVLSIGMLVASVIKIFLLSMRAFCGPTITTRERFDVFCWLLGGLVMFLVGAYLSRL